MSSPEAADRRRLVGAALVVGSIVVASFGAGVDPGALADERGLDEFAALLGDLLHPDLSAPFLARIARLALESLLIGVLGLAFALVLGVPLAVAAARLPALPDPPTTRPWRRRGREAIRLGARGLLAFFRSVPEIVWAYLFVRIFGLGPGPAVLALALTFAGIIGKLYAELVEAADPEPARRLRAAGVGWLGVLGYGVLPLVGRQWLAYGLFRLECAIRSASILGVVGAGGLGHELALSIRYFQYDKLATALLAVLAYVVVLELAGARLRRTGAIWSHGLLAGGVIAALVLLPIPWAALTSSEAARQTAEFVAGFTEPNLRIGFVSNALVLAIETIAMAWVATLLAAPLAFVLAPLGAVTFTIRGYLADPPRRWSPGRAAAALVLGIARLIAQITRALPELVWALLFVVWVGPGPTAGVLALAVHTAGILVRLYGDVLEEAEPDPPRTLEAGGAGRTARYLYGVVPQVAPRLAAFTLFRFEVNVRNAAMVGFVGAGGLGDAIHTAISLFHMRDLATYLIVLLATVTALDWAGDRLRVRWLRR